MTNVLFVCVANSGRSVMAERIFRQLTRDHHQARSAGSDPGTAPHPQVVDALREIGIEASPPRWTRFESRAAGPVAVRPQPFTVGTRRVSSNVCPCCTIA